MKKLTDEQMDLLLKKQSISLPEKMRVSEEFVHKEIKRREKAKAHRKPLRRPLVSVAVTLGILLVVFNGVALATGHQPLDVIVRFSHVFGNGAAGSGYSLKSPVLQKAHKSSPAATQKKGNEQSGIKAASSGGAHTKNILKLNNYNGTLNHFIGMTNYPRMNMTGVNISSVETVMVNQKKEVFYMFVDGYIKGPGKQSGSLTLDLYHNTPGNVSIDGQTTSKHKAKINLAGVKATYAGFTNKDSSTGYIAWRDGSWTFVLHSINISKKQLVKVAQTIENQVHTK